MNLKDLNHQLSVYTKELSAACVPLEYSYAKVKSQGLPSFEDFEKLETWESFTARFSRLSDIFTKKCLRTQILLSDPDFRGSLMDHLNQAEKLGLITHANRWWSIRALRNKVAHDYTQDELLSFFKNVLDECPFVLEESKAFLKKNAPT